MIQANELRIGNWVIRLTNNNMFVQYEKVSLIPMHDLQSSYVKPIPLTEEILLKCGFERYSDELIIKLGNRYYFLCYSLVTNIVFTENTEVEDDGVVYHEHIKHLHQLQNLYFALTGQELNIEL